MPYLVGFVGLLFLVLVGIWWWLNRTRLAQNRQLWARVVIDSDAYMQAMRLDAGLADLIEEQQTSQHGNVVDLQFITRNVFLALEVSGKNFGFYVHHVCGKAYGGDWKICVLAVCQNDESLNATVGKGTHLICAVPDYWRDALIQSIKSYRKTG